MYTLDRLDFTILKVMIVLAAGLLFSSNCLHAEHSESNITYISKGSKSIRILPISSGVKAGFKYYSSAERAFRIDVGFRYSKYSREVIETDHGYNTSLVVDNYDGELFESQLGFHLLNVKRIREDIYLAWGPGTEFQIRPFSLGGEYSNPTFFEYTALLNIEVGFEWFPSKRMSFFGDYTVGAYRNWENSKYEDFGVSRETKRNEIGLYTNTLWIGLSFYL